LQGRVNKKFILRLFSICISKERSKKLHFSLGKQSLKKLFHDSQDCLQLPQAFSNKIKDSLFRNVFLSFQAISPFLAIHFLRCSIKFLWDLLRKNTQQKNALCNLGSILFEILVERGFISIFIFQNWLNLKSWGKNFFLPIFKVPNKYGDNNKNMKRILISHIFSWKEDFYHVPFPKKTMKLD